MSSPQALRGAQGSSHCLGATTGGDPLSKRGPCPARPLPSDVTPSPLLIPRLGSPPVAWGHQDPPRRSAVASRCVSEAPDRPRPLRGLRERQPPGTSFAGNLVGTPKFGLRGVRGVTSAPTPGLGGSRHVWGVADWGAQGRAQRLGSVLGTGGVGWLWGLHLAHTWGSCFFGSYQARCRHSFRVILHFLQEKVPAMAFGLFPSHFSFSFSFSLDECDVISRGL